jgi:hypothetical protein
VRNASVGDIRAASYDIVELIAATTTQTGLTVQCAYDAGCHGWRAVVASLSLDRR